MRIRGHELHLEDNLVRTKCDMADRQPLRIPRCRRIRRIDGIGSVLKEKKPEVRNEIFTTLAPVLDAVGATLLCSWRYTGCGRKVRRLATLCTNRQRCCHPLHMTVRLTPAIDSVQVWTSYNCYAIVESVWGEVVFVRSVTKMDRQKFEQCRAIKFFVKLGYLSFWPHGSACS
jgi:hypothetical protein